MKSYIPFLFAVLFSGMALAQDYCYLVSFHGDTLKGETLAYKDPILRSPYFQIDEQEVIWDGVKLIRNEHGVFANVSHLHRGDERYAMRIKTGDISVFERVEMDIYGRETLPSRLDANEEQALLATGELNYLMDETGRLYKPTYQHMKAMMGGSEMASAHLKRFRTFQWVKRGLAYGGGGLLAVSFLSMTGGFVMSPQLIIGILMSGGSFFLNEPMNDMRWLAVDSYNAGTTSSP